MRERVEILPKTESTTQNQKLNHNEGASAQNRSHDNVFKASGAKSEKAKQVDDDKGTMIMSYKQPKTPQTFSKFTGLFQLVNKLQQTCQFH